jgi:general secretion pathway protein G
MNNMNKFNSKLVAMIKRNDGFSLIELMIVIGIIGLLVAVVGPNLIQRFEIAKRDTTRMNIKSLSTALKSFRLECGQYPTTDQGLDALKAKPTTGQPCKNYAPGGYIEQSIPKDGWDRPFSYESDGNDFEIKSYGKDRREGGAELDADISSKDPE